MKLCRLEHLHLLTFPVCCCNNWTANVNSWFIPWLGSYHFLVRVWFLSHRLQHECALWSPSIEQRGDLRVHLKVLGTVSVFNVHNYLELTNNLPHKHKLQSFFSHPRTDLSQLHATPDPLGQIHLCILFKLLIAPRVPRKKNKNWCLSTRLNHIPRSSFTALLPVNSTNTKAANCCLHNLQPFNSTNPHIGSHEGRGVGVKHFTEYCLPLFLPHNPLLLLGM